MKRRFSAKEFNERMEEHSRELTEFYNSKTYKERKKKSGNLTIKVGKDVLKAVENIQRINDHLLLLKNAGVDVSALINGERQNRIKECELVFKSMNSYAISKGLITPLDEDEFAGFYLWLHASGDDHNFWPDRNLYYEFDKHMKESLGILKKAGKRSFNGLRQIFINDDAYNLCVYALRKVDPPIISEDNRFLLGPKQKGAFTAWYEVVKENEKFADNVLLTDIVYCLNKEIKGLNLGTDGSTLRRKRTTMYRKYIDKFLRIIR